MKGLYRIVPALAALLTALLLAALPARADTAIAQSLTYRGQMNFTGTVQTLRTRSNSSTSNGACSVASSVSASLTGIPTGATIQSAQLYWAGSGDTLDTTVTLNGQTVRAGRQYTSQTGNGVNYFSGAADVGAIVKGNGTYTFSGLSVTATDPWCAVQGVLGGFALLVVYSHPDEPFRLLNVYEGFKSFQNNGFTINLSNFNVPNPLPANVTGRVGHITWEGDDTLSQGGESLLFSGKELTDTMNPSGNQFNSASNISSNSASYGIDFDAYTLDSRFITAGQTSGTTTYRSGQDLVLLSAEIVAMPFVGNADLSLAMTRTGDLRVGSTAYYTLTATNNGSDVETGPVTIVDTLPAGLKLVSTSGSGWTCTNAAGSNGATVVTCTRPGQVLAGASMVPLNITVTPGSSGNFTNTATVSGRTGDANTGNNTASNASAAFDSGSAAVVFTTEVCKDGDPIVTAPSEAGCHRFIGPVTAAAANTKIYVTAVAGARASAQSNYDQVLTIGLAATCLPYTNVALTYAQAGLGLDCKGSWKYVQITLPAGKPTAVLPNGSAFFYADVGRVSMSLSYLGITMGTVNFISRPTDIRFQSVFRSADSVADLMGTVADNWKKPTPTAFAKAGEQFTMRLGAQMADGNFAPSFGKEPTALKGIMGSDLTNLDIELDLFAANPLATPVLPVSDNTGTLDGVVNGAFVLDQDFTLNAGVAGAFDAKARWFEAGYLAATPYLTDYLGTGQVGGPPDGVAATAQARIVGGTRVIGHFYPDHFETTLVASFQCAADMNCPPAPTAANPVSFPPSGVVYSTQPFAFTLTPFSLPKNGVAQPLSLFRNLAPSAANGNQVGTTVYRNVGLSAVVKPNDTTSAVLSGFSLDPATPLQTSSGPANFPAMNGNAAYTLGKPYTATDNASGMLAPTLFYLRASMNERLVTGPATTRDIVVSSTTPAASPATQYEDGLMVVSGRLFVPNVAGSELLRQKVALTAQYWNGKSWVTATTDNGSTVADAMQLSNCTRFFIDPAKKSPNNCKTDAIAAYTPGAVSLSGGIGKLELKSPGRGNTGSVAYTVSGGASGAWLPSTKARATFGMYRNPVIYLREVY
jgi:MSHA biogenesis protein MshQ